MSSRRIFSIIALRIGSPSAVADTPISSRRLDKTVVESTTLFDRNSATVRSKSSIVRRSLSRSDSARPQLFEVGHRSLVPFRNANCLPAEGQDDLSSAPALDHEELGGCFDIVMRFADLI